MKVGVVGVGFVGTACAKAMMLRGSCDELVLCDVDEERAKGVATDLFHGASLCPAVKVRAGTYSDLADAAVIILSAGINERKGGATKKSDPRGRLLLLPENGRLYEDLIPRLLEIAPGAIILVVTDPPDALADVARRFAPPSHPIISTGTFLDTLRFKTSLAEHFGCNANSVDALVLGEHGTSQVYMWSLARVGGISIRKLVDESCWSWNKFKTKVERAVRFANIDVIRGTGASQHAIGIVTARIVEVILRDERLVLPLGVLAAPYTVTLSLPCVLGSQGVHEVLIPQMSAREARGLRTSESAIAAALDEYDGRKNQDR